MSYAKQMLDTTRVTSISTRASWPPLAEIAAPLVPAANGGQERPPLPLV